MLYFLLNVEMNCFFKMKVQQNYHFKRFLNFIKFFSIIKVIECFLLFDSFDQDFSTFVDHFAQLNLSGFPFLKDLTYLNKFINLRYLFFFLVNLLKDGHRLK